jgi:membrane protein
MVKNTTSSDANHPVGFSREDWWQIILRLFDKIQSDNLSLVAAGVALYFLLALFPMIAALVSLYGLLVSPSELNQHMANVVGFLPQESRYLIQDQIENIVTKKNSTLGIGFALSLALAIWSGGKGSSALMTACNITYGEQSDRSLFVKLLLRFIFTLSALVLVILALFLITIFPVLIGYISGIELSRSQSKFLSWPFLILIFNFALAALYRYAPSRKKAKWRWVTPGATFATILWIVASYAFTIYVTEFAQYNETYGSIGGVIVLIMWFYMSAFVILLGAEINSVMELQTHRDSTIGEAQPMGKRGAHVADHKAESKD